LDARAGEDDDADRYDGQHLIVALERRGFGVFGPVGLEGDLRHLADVGPARGDLFGAFGRTAVHQHHVGVFGVDVIEFCPDPLVVGAVAA